ncbi:MAG: acyltransferase domain-containing protein [Nakamurella sp.]
MNDETALLAGLDPESRAGVEVLLGAMDDRDISAGQRIRNTLVSDLGNLDGQEPPEAGSSAWLAASIDAVPTVADWMRRRGVDELIVSATLSDVGRQLQLHHRHTGRVGFDVPGWMGAVLCGNFYQLGRLQFELRQWRGGEPRPAISAGEFVLDVHIPATGPLDPPAVLASFAQAADFFPRYFPKQLTDLAICGTWLLDPYLVEHLPATSNITAFQQQFTLYGEPRDDELDAMYFVFGRRSLDNLDDLPRRTALQRLVLTRIEAGGSWQVVHGFRALTGQNSSGR